MKSTPNTLEAATRDLFEPADALAQKYSDAMVARLLRLREMYAWIIANPAVKDRQFVEEHMRRFHVSKFCAYSDLSIIKQILPNLSAASRDFHRWRYNEMILETYSMAKKRGDSKTMERAASSYAKFNRVDLEDEKAIPFDKIIIQPFTATQDPSVLGIKPIPNLRQQIDSLLQKYRAETIDIEDVEFEEADLEEDELFPQLTLHQQQKEQKKENIL